MKKWTIILNNDNRSEREPISFIVTSKQINYIFLFLFVFLFSSLSLYVFARVNNLDPNTIQNVYAKKEALVNRIDNRNKYIDKLFFDVASLIESEKRLRTFSNLLPISDDVRQMGFGGSEIIDKRISSLDFSTRKMIENIDRRLFQMNNISSFEIGNFKQVGANLNEEYDLLKHTPSVKPTEGNITSSFGERVDPFSHGEAFHGGLDIANDMSTPICTPADGKVIFCDYLPGYGKTVKIDHGYGYITLYGHLTKSLVNVGDVVTRHQKIALMGSTGRSTASHLHYEVRIFNKKINPSKYIDPDSILQ